MKTDPTLNSRAAWRIAAKNLDVLSRRLEVIADNLANAETAGHKRVVSADHLFFQAMDRARNEASQRSEVRRDFGQGTLVQNGNPRELGLDGEGFLAVELGDDLAYTRSAQLWVSPDGVLVDQRGLVVLGDGGPIEVPEGQEPLLTVGEDGTVRAGEAALGKLSINRFADPQALRAAGPGLFRAAPENAPQVATETRVLSGWRERSNVDPLRELVAMIQLQRQFESTRRAIDQSSQLSQELSQSLRG